MHQRKDGTQRKILVQSRNTISRGVLRSTNQNLKIQVQLSTTLPQVEVHAKLGAATLRHQTGKIEPGVPAKATKKYGKLSLPTEPANVENM